MNKNSLSSLYRRLACAPADAIDAADVASAADGSLDAGRRESVAGHLAGSSAHARLAHMLRDLSADSEALAADVARLTERNVHRRREAAPVRRAGAPRRFGVSRWAAMAACLVAVMGALTLRHSLHRPATPTAAVARADEIFSTRDTIFDANMDRAKHPSRSDRVFHGDFSGG